MRNSDAEYTVTFMGRRVQASPTHTKRADPQEPFTGDVYKVTKFTPSTNDLTEYEVVRSSFGEASLTETCNCPGGRHKDCKHRRMVREYINALKQVVIDYHKREDGE